MSSLSTEADLTVVAGKHIELCGICVKHMSHSGKFITFKGTGFRQHGFSPGEFLPGGSHDIHAQRQIRIGFVQRKTGQQTCASAEGVTAGMSYFGQSVVFAHEKCARHIPPRTFFFYCPEGVGDSFVRAFNFITICSQNFRIALTCQNFLPAAFRVIGDVVGMFPAQFIIVVYIIL